MDRATNSNNPYHRAAAGYDSLLSLPIIAQIRRQEARAVGELLSRYADPGGRVLEVGPGTGYYTLGLAQTFQEVLAVEDSPAMAELLSARLAEAGVGNVTVVQGDFRALPLEGPFEVAVAVGVLDYVAEGAAFVGKLLTLARRAVVLTAPQRALWGACFAAANRVRGTVVYRYQRDEVAAWAPGWSCLVVEAGLRTRLTRGLTLAVALERPAYGAPV